MNNKNEQLVEYARSLGINLTIDPSLDKYSGKSLFPEKVEEAKKVLTNLKMVRK
jgi:hypothetical protein